MALSGLAFPDTIRPQPESSQRSGSSLDLSFQVLELWAFGPVIASVFQVNAGGLWAAEADVAAGGQDADLE